LIAIAVSPQESAASVRLAAAEGNEHQAAESAKAAANSATGQTQLVIAG
jgi:hypothetical protein